MRNDLTIYDEVADQWWLDDIRWVRTLKNLVPGRLKWFDRHIDWHGRQVLDLGCAGGFMAEALAARGAHVTGIDPARIGQWQSGTLAFDNVTLAEAVAEMNRYATTRIVIADPALAAERISGVFPAGEQDAFAEALALYLPLKAEGKGGRIVLMRADVRAD